MITKSDIEELISHIPAIPNTLKICEKELLQNNLTKAVEVAEQDIAFVMYMRSVINKPVFGLAKDVQDITQIFSLIGTYGMLNILSSYYVLLTTPKKWTIFNLDNIGFANLQTDFLENWTKILTAIEISDKEILRSITLIPASICLCNKIFENHIVNLNHIIRSSGLSYNEILKREIGADIFELSCRIAQKWGLSNKIIDIFQNLNKPSKKTKVTTYMNLLISYELSKAEFKNVGFGEFFEYNFEFSEDELKVFMRAIEYEA